MHIPPCFCCTFLSPVANSYIAPSGSVSTYAGQAEQCGPGRGKVRRPQLPDSRSIVQSTPQFVPTPSLLPHTGTPDRSLSRTLPPSYGLFICDAARCVGVSPLGVNSCSACYSDLVWLHTEERERAVNRVPCVNGILAFSRSEP